MIIKTMTSVLLVFMLSSSVPAQELSLSVYNVNKKAELPLALGLFAYNAVGFQLINKKSLLDSTDLAHLDANDIWAFDRIATRQDASFTKRAMTLSDIGMNTSILLPFALGLDKSIRKDWTDLLVLYAETQAINSALYVMGAGAFNRKRPLVYNPDIPDHKKMSSGTKVSFFSGHVSTAATCGFFAAKVYSDYHAELGNKKYWLYAAALAPPAFVGYYRVKASKHFPTDVITGAVVGAAVGVFIPHFHKNKNVNNNLSLMPFSGKTVGLNVCYSFN